MSASAVKNAFHGGIKAIFQLNFTTCLETHNPHVVRGNYFYMLGHLVLCIFSLCLS